MSENFDIKVRVDPTGAVAGSKQAEKALDGLEKKGEKTKQSLLDMGKAMGGMFVAAGGAAVVGKLAAIDDEYTNLRNSAMKFADAGRTVDDVLREQRDLAHELKTGTNETIGAYDAVRDATDGLNLTHAEQIRLTKTLGEAAQMGGSSMESAAQAMQGLSVAFETGQDPARALRGIFKQFPDLTEQMTSSLGMTKSELLDMAISGQIGFEKLVRSMTSATDSIDQKFGQRAKTWSQTWHELTDAIERPISLDHLLTPFGTLEQSISRIANEVDALTRRWSALEADKQRQGFVGLADGISDVIDEAKRYADVALHAAGVTDEWRVETEKDTKALRDQRDAALSAAEALAAFRNAKIDTDRYASVRGDMSFNLDRGDSVTGGTMAAPDDAFNALAENRRRSDELNQQMLEGLAAARQKRLEEEAKANAELVKKAKEAAQETKEAWAAGLGEIGGSFLKAAADGKQSWHDMTEQMIRDLTRLAIKMAIMRLASGGGSGAVAGQFLGGLAGGAHGFDYVANSSALQLPGFAHGGDMVMGGGGGVDSHVAAFRVSHGESVHVRTGEQRLADQQWARDANQAMRTMAGGGTGPTRVNVIVQNDPREVTAVMGTYEGKRAIARVDRSFARRRAG
jgi:tape measure domain-containing protein